MKGKPVVCVETLESFPSIRAAARSFNVVESSIRYALRNDSKLNKKFTWNAGRLRQCSSVKPRERLVLGSAFNFRPHDSNLNVHKSIPTF
eukprot:g691.t1